MQSKNECAKKYKIQKYNLIFHSDILQLQLLVEFLQFGPCIMHTGAIQSDMTLQSNYNLEYFTECHINIITR